ncbi:2Fe-2S iron-sulfur cluster-binding protein [Streptomyces sp. HNM0574]|uniref:2Fe-2S iron-sulfur cluster-binding protein n=1 Tax=Streptomyces sp. HNM0574 TaxID=2714954 RepID=UPI001F0FD191|nr:2Fe-2S iron-sulfur cluster-binding protein [Streptomyces sp. HNM0574]
MSNGHDYEGSGYDTPREEPYDGQYRSHDGGQSWPAAGSGYDPAWDGTPPEGTPYDPAHFEAPAGHTAGQGFEAARYDGYEPAGYGAGYDNSGYAPGGYDASGYGTSGYDGSGQVAPEQGAGDWGGPASYPRPTQSWGAGEYDADATAFVQLPAGGLPGADPFAGTGTGAQGYGDPLAAPGTGQGAYTPPAIDPAAGTYDPAPGPPTPAATTDPAATGHWTLPFAPQAPDSQSEAAHGQESTAQRGGSGFNAGMLSTGSEHGTEPGAGPSLGAAAALAGSHEARTRRPLGTGVDPGLPAPEQNLPEHPGGPVPDGGLPGEPQPYPQAQPHARALSDFEPQPDGTYDGGQGLPPVADAYAQPQPYSLAQPQPRPEPQAESLPGPLSGPLPEPDALPAQQDVPEPAAYGPGALPQEATSGTGELSPQEQPFTGAPEASAAEQPVPGEEFPSAGPEPEDAGDAAAPEPRDAAPEPAPGDAVEPDGAPGPETGTPPEAEAEPVPEPAGAEAEPAAEPETEPTAEPGTDPAPEGTEPATDAPAPDEPPAADAPAPDAPAGTPVAEVPAVDTEHPHTSYVLHVNGVDRLVSESWIGESLLYVLRERLGLAGAKDGCSQGECGACSVQVDGRLVAACLVPAATAAGSEIRTVEGLATDGEQSDVQRALACSGAVQCGFCVPGMAMAVHDLLEGNHKPTELETRQAICGNLCRCSGYRGVLDAVRTVVDERAAKAQHAEQDGQQGQDAQSGPEAGQQPAEHPAEVTARIPHQAGPGAGGAQVPEDGPR